MNLKDLLDSVKQKKDNIKNGVVRSSRYTFLFRNLKNFEELLNLGETSFFCRTDTIKDVFKAKQKADNLIINYVIKDLFYVGAMKTLLPSLEIGGDKLFFHVGMLIGIPNENILPATLEWGDSAIFIYGWEDEYRNFIGLKLVKHKVAFVSINFTSEEREKLTKALKLSLQIVPPSDFECDLWDDDYGERRLGIRSGIPFFSDYQI